MMRVALSVLSLIALSAPLTADDKNKAVEKLVGTWTMVSRDLGDGPNKMDGFKLVITDKTISFRAPSGATKLMGNIARVDDASKPAQIDLKNGKETGVGIYELKGDDLKLIVCDPGQERPKEFKGSAMGMLFVLKREKK